MARCNPYASGSALIGIGVPPQCHDASAKAPSEDMDAAAAMEQVKLHEHVPAGVNEPAASLIRTLLDQVKATGRARVRVATWPDGAWAVLAFNADWEGPRPEQLQRAYRNARSQGLTLSPM